MNDVEPYLALALKAVGPALGAATIALVALGVTNTGTLFILLSVGLFALAVGSIMDGNRLRQLSQARRPRPPRRRRKRR